MENPVLRMADSAAHDIYINLVYYWIVFQSYISEGNCTCSSQFLSKPICNNAAYSTMLHFSNKTKTKFSQGIFFPKKWPKLCICIWFNDLWSFFVNSLSILKKKFLKKIKRNFGLNFRLSAFLNWPKNQIFFRKLNLIMEHSAWSR